MLVSGWLASQAHPAPVRPQPAESASSAINLLLARAEKAIIAGNMGKARSELQQAIKKDPKSARSYLMLGTLELQAGEFKESTAHLHVAVRLDPSCFGCHYNLALALLQRTNWREAACELKRALALNPHSSDAAYNLGLALLELNKPSQAATELRKAWTLDLNRSDVAYNLIRAELAAREFTQAQKTEEQSRKVLGADSRWLTSVAQLFLDANLPQPAVVCLAQALKVNPSQQQARRLLAAAYLDLDRSAAALAVIPKRPTSEDDYLRSSAFFLLGQPQKAQQALNEALKQLPNEPRYLLLGARIDQQLGRYVLALQFLVRARQGAPDWPAPYYSSAVSLYFLHRYSDCRRSLDQALQLNPRFGKALFLYAVTLVIEGRDAEAEVYLERAIAIEPENARLRLHLGALLLREGRLLQAYKAFRVAAHLKPDYALAHYELGKIQVRSSHPKAALSELEKAIVDQPHLAKAYYQLGRAYAALGEKQKSASAFTKFNKLKRARAHREDEFLEFADQELEVSSRAGGP